MKPESLPSGPIASHCRVEWTYDAEGRRIGQKTSLWTNGTWIVVEDLKFVSDPLLFGRHIAELNAANNALVRSYVWGLDLSGSLDGAGGVGGLLWVGVGSAVPSGPQAHFCAYNGNGNVAALLSADTGTETARYEYAPFGEPIRVTGPMAKENPFRFSTKRTDNTTDFVLYEYRLYNPTTGRWLSRDPIGERGGLGLYLYAENWPTGRIDVDGRFWAHLHALATGLAGFQAGLNGACILILIAGNISTDVLPAVMNDHAYHYTRPIYGDKAAALARSTETMLKLLEMGCEMARQGKCKRGLWLLGMGLHVQQDYWAHVVDGQPVSYDPRAERGEIGYPPDDYPNHKDHARDFDVTKALEAAGVSYMILQWAKHSCLGCCCN